MKVNRELARLAKQNGICEEWFNDLLTTEDKGKLIKMYLDGIDFCLSNEYPPLPFIKKHFALREMHPLAGICQPSDFFFLQQFQPAVLAQQMAGFVVVNIDKSHWRSKDPFLSSHSNDNRYH